MAAPGIVIASAPFPGDVYRQEFLLGQAEDMAKVATVGQRLGQCACGATFRPTFLETEEWTPIEPDVLEYKYYAPRRGHGPGTQSGNRRTRGAGSNDWFAISPVTRREDPGQNLRRRGRRRYLDHGGHANQPFGKSHRSERR